MAPPARRTGGSRGCREGVPRWRRRSGHGAGRGCRMRNHSTACCARGRVGGNRRSVDAAGRRGFSPEWANAGLPGTVRATLALPCATRPACQEAPCAASDRVPAPCSPALPRQACSSVRQRAGHEGPRHPDAAVPDRRAPPQPVGDHHDDPARSDGQAEARQRAARPSFGPARQRGRRYRWSARAPDSRPSAATSSTAGRSTRRSGALYDSVGSFGNGLRRPSAISQSGGQPGDHRDRRDVQRHGRFVRPDLRPLGVPGAHRPRPRPGLGDPAVARLGEADRRRDRHRRGARRATRQGALRAPLRRGRRHDRRRQHAGRLLAVAHLRRRLAARPRHLVRRRPGPVHGHRQVAHPRHPDALGDPARPGPGEGLDARAGRHHPCQGAAAGRLGAGVLVGGAPASTKTPAPTKSATKTPTKPDRD